MAASTVTRTEWVAIIDKALETAIATAQNVTITRAGGTTGEQVTRQEALKLLVQRAIRKGTQSRMRPEVDRSPPAGLGA